MRTNLWGFESKKIQKWKLHFDKADCSLYFVANKSKVLLTCCLMAVVKAEPKLKAFFSLAVLYYPCDQPTFQLCDQGDGLAREKQSKNLIHKQVKQPSYLQYNEKI